MSQVDPTGHITLALMVAQTLLLAISVLHLV